MTSPMPLSLAAVAPAVALPIRLKAPSVALLGEPGAGKTHSLITLLSSGIEVFVIVTDPNGLDTILDQIRLHPRSADLMPMFHWALVSPAAPGWAAMRQMGLTVASMGYEDIAKIKSGVGKEHMQTFTKLISTCVNFHCERTNLDFGDVTSWSDRRALVIDSLSGINKIMKDHTVGYKPSLHQGEWGIAMNLEEQLIFTLCSDLQCYFVLMAHLDKVVNEVTGIPQISMAALGNKLAPQLIKLFSEVVHVRREAANFYWSVSELNMAVKNRALPISARLAPDFAPIIAAHNARKLALEPTSA